MAWYLASGAFKNFEKKRAWYLASPTCGTFKNFEKKMKKYLVSPFSSLFRVPRNCKWRGTRV